MQQRKSLVGRPLGTDGSDFSYRMVVDSRYQRVAKGKSRLYALFLLQAIIQIIGVLYRFLWTAWKEGPNRIAIASFSVSLVSLLIGELGRRRSRSGLLKLYIFGSCAAISLSIACILKGNLTLEDIKHGANWDLSKFERLETARILLGLIFQVFTISTVISLIRNMSPPKKAS